MKMRQKMDKKIKTKKKKLSYQKIAIDKNLLTPLLIRIKSLRKEKKSNKKLRKAQERK